MYSTRRSRTSPWSAPKPLLSPDVEPRLGGLVTWSCLTKGGLGLIAAVERNTAVAKNFLAFTRENVQQPFRKFRFVEDGAVSSRVRCPRYVEATGELFMTGHPKVEPLFGIGAIKNLSVR